MTKLATSPTGNAPATTAPEGKLTLRKHLESPAFLDAVKKALPRHLKPDRFIRVAITAMTKTPKLAQCDQASFFNALLTLSQLGLEPDGRRAHLIPFENRKRNVVECQLIVDYKGLAELVYRSGVVSYLHADVVRDGDLFDFSKGELKTHVPWFLRRDDEKPNEPGNIYAIYSLARMKDGSEKAEVLALSEVISIRDNSQGWRAFKNGYAKQSPWDPENPVSEQEMMKKTAFRRLSKWLPLSPEIRDAVESDDDAPPMKNVTPGVAGGLTSLLGTMPASGNDADVSAAPPEESASDDAATEHTATAEDRERVIEELKDLMLNHEVPETKLWQYAVTGKHVPEGVDELWALPTTVLDKLRAAVPALSTKKGGK